MTGTQPTTTHTILIVEDVFMIRRTLELILRSANFEVLEAEDARAAMKALKEGHKIHLILLDIMMPEIDGITFCKLLKTYEATREVPILMCTAQGDATTVTEAMVAGANGFIVKPFTRETVLAKIDALLGIQRKKILDEPLRKKKHPKPEKGKDKKAAPAKGKETKEMEKEEKKKEEKPDTEKK